MVKNVLPTHASQAKLWIQKRMLELCAPILLLSSKSRVPLVCVVLKQRHPEYGLGNSLLPINLLFILICLVLQVQGFSSQDYDVYLAYENFFWHLTNSLQQQFSTSVLWCSGEPWVVHWCTMGVNRFIEGLNPSPAAWCASSIVQVLMSGLTVLAPGWCVLR